MRTERTPVVVEWLTDAADLAVARKQREQFDRNSDWLQLHLPEIYAQHRGKCICIAGEELFVGMTTQEAVDQARARHPNDQGWFTRYIPLERLARIYAY
ncbi:MAG: hypothetical protein NTY19_43030 [Planctomycetota bacterium]|nr:hypothetical protein [Planctomycetota bacterium]